MANRTCERCGAGLGFKNQHARFCSVRCRVAAHRAAKRAPRFPAAMTSRRRWVRRETNKRPVTTSGRSASSTNAATWATFDDAAASTAGVGLGFVLGDGIGCFDLDHCLTDGRLEPWAADVLAEIQQPILFAEVSQSGTGVHVFVEAPEGPGAKIRDGRNIEFYSKDRYIAVTGEPFSLPR
ncbi:bifunctional DNA primase/polymerase [Zhihengliuella flava]|uniref:Primase-polymerase (Primpol)-like protein n=1 Tax=Zhihengliuella flava TaxID=1285193 RepID=A0A931GE86_9MICC|nr:bifunctional DNA primase/polymerase [Zhihengliuella flava]MBG6083252.1 primase-polymerase (primpol)-like protein [Zhihengliuella flava]